VRGRASCDARDINRSLNLAIRRCMRSHAAPCRRSMDYSTCHTGCRWGDWEDYAIAKVRRAFFFAGGRVAPEDLRSSCMPANFVRRGPRRRWRTHFERQLALARQSYLVMLEDVQIRRISRYSVSMNMTSGPLSRTPIVKASMVRQRKPVLDRVSPLQPGAV